MRRVLLVLTLVLIAVALTPLTAQATTVTEHCQKSHELPDDPIVFPGQPGASHLHVFAGNRTTNAFSTPQSLAANPATTCGDQPQDASGYWVPAVYIDGVENSLRLSPYWQDNGQRVEAPPFGLQLVTQRLWGFNAFFACTAGSSVTTQLPDCTTGGPAKLRVFFPQCWDGVGLGNADVVYPIEGAQGKTCPAGFTHRIPQLLLQVNTTYNNLQGHTVTLASGDHTTMHADWMNAFAPAAMQTIVDRLNA